MSITRINSVESLQDMFDVKQQSLIRQKPGLIRQQTLDSKSIKDTKINKIASTPTSDELKDSNNSNNNRGTSSSRSKSTVQQNISKQPTSATSTNQDKPKDFDYYYQKCLKTISTSINIIKALMMRIIFSLHSLIAIVYVYIIKKDEWYLVNIVGLVFMSIEVFITIFKRHGKEPKWFFPCFFIYICTMIPPIWFVELTRIEIANGKKRPQNLTSLTDLGIEDILGNSLGINDTLNNLNLDINTIAVYLEISLMILVIMGRWFLPKGNISRSALSQLLLVYMSLASDEFDLLSLLNETNVQESPTMSYFTLSIFSWSLFQFSLNLVVTRGRTFQSISTDEQNDNIEDDFDEDDDCSTKTFVEKINKHLSNSGKGSISGNPSQTKSKCACFKKFFDMIDTEIWSILITLIFQDGPFLALRLTAVFKFNVRTFITMFFTCKNAIILFLQFYRLSAIYLEAHHDQNTEAKLASNKEDALASLNAAAVHLDRYVVLSYTQTMLLRNKVTNKPKLPSNVAQLEESEKRLMTLNPILIRSTLSRFHSYAIVLTQNYNLTVACCECECHPKESNFIYS